MSKNVKVLSLTLLTVAVLAVANNYAMSDAIPNLRIAVVDVQTVVTSSSQVKATAEERNSKLKDLQAFVDKAKAEIVAEKSAKKKKEIEDRSYKELNTRKNAIDKEYAQKISVIDAAISCAVAKEAKDKNYNLVLSKGVVLFGGDDITESVLKAVN